jgi:hypothetical protein
MLRTITLKQFIELKVFYEQEPRGELREDLRHARSLHLLYNLNVTKEHQRPLEDFYLKFESDIEESRPEPPKQTNEDKLLIFRILAESAGGNNSKRRTND